MQKQNKDRNLIINFNLRVVERKTERARNNFSPQRVEEANFKKNILFR